MTDNTSESGGSPCTTKGTRQAIVVMTSHNISEGSFGGKRVLRVAAICSFLLALMWQAPLLSTRSIRGI